MIDAEECRVGLHQQLWNVLERLRHQAVLFELADSNLDFLELSRPIRVGSHDEKAAHDLWVAASKNAGHVVLQRCHFADSFEELFTMNSGDSSDNDHVHHAGNHEQGSPQVAENVKGLLVGMGISLHRPHIRHKVIDTKDLGNHHPHRTVTVTTALVIPGSEDATQMQASLLTCTRDGAPL